MKLLTSEQVKEADKYTIENEPIISVNLMERAACRMVEWVSSHCHTYDQFKFFAGPGNNGGDTWALARLLYKMQFTNISFYLLNISGKISPDSQINRKRLKEETSVKIVEITSEADFPDIDQNDIVIEGLFGSGLSRPLEGTAAGLVRHINQHNCKNVLSIDIPSGLFGEDNSGNNSDNIIQADYTLTIQFPKLSFFFPENARNVGEYVVMDIGLHPAFIEKVKTPFNYLSTSDVASLLKPRDKFSHKGTYGHGLLIAGSYGMMGAAILASRAAQRTGIGLVTTHIPRFGYDIMQTAVPESLISIDQSDIIFTGFPDLSDFNAVAAGPGLGKRSNTKKALLNLIEKADRPLVLDADALNILGENKEWIGRIPENSILTPHPKEFERITQKFGSGYERNRFQRDFSVRHKLIVVLKGAHTAITLADGSCYFNTKGNPGMASGGTGDVLTGMVLSLLAQGYSPADAAITGVYLHGRAADLAVHDTGQQALIATDIINYIGKAFLDTGEKKGAF